MKHQNIQSVGGVVHVRYITLFPHALLIFVRLPWVAGCGCGWAHWLPGTAGPIGLQMHRPALQPVPVRWHPPVLKPQPVPLPAQALVCGMEVGFTPSIQRHWFPRRIFANCSVFYLAPSISPSLPVSQLPQPAQAPVCASLPSGTTLRGHGRDAFISLIFVCKALLWHMEFSPKGWV